MRKRNSASIGEQRSGRLFPVQRESRLPLGPDRTAEAPEQKRLQGELQKAIARNETVVRMYEKLYEDNASGKVTDEWFMQLSHKYEVERMELKDKITDYRQRLSELGTLQQG